MSFTESFLSDAIGVVNRIDTTEIERAVDVLVSVRQAQGRLFLIGSGGGAGHSSHAACDFRKLCNLEAYAPYDNVSELTARSNDEGWETTISNWLKTSKLSSRDCLMVFSVGGGSETENISMNIVNAVKLAKAVGSAVVGIVGKDGGYTGEHGDAVIIVPPVNAKLVTPLTEGFQSVIWHLLVSHPKLQQNTAKWESVEALVATST